MDIYDIYVGLTQNTLQCVCVCVSMITKGTRCDSAFHCGSFTEEQGFGYTGLSVGSVNLGFSWPLHEEIYKI